MRSSPRPAGCRRSFPKAPKRVRFSSRRPCLVMRRVSQLRCLRSETGASPVQGAICQSAGHNAASKTAEEGSIPSWHAGVCSGLRRCLASNVCGFNSRHLHYAGLFRKAPRLVFESKRVRHPWPALRLSVLGTSGFCKAGGSVRLRREALLRSCPKGEGPAFQAEDASSNLADRSSLRV
jgi:hypothetical protein